MRYRQYSLVFKLARRRASKNNPWRYEIAIGECGRAVLQGDRDHYWSDKEKTWKCKNKEACIIKKVIEEL